MSAHDHPPEEPRRGEGARTAGQGTPFAVDVSADYRARRALAMFVAAPAIWSLHFLLVYFAVEAGCSGSGPGLRLFDPPVPTVLTLAATALAVLGCLACARWSYRRWRASRQEPDRRDGGEVDRFGQSRSLAFAGFLLSLLGVVAVLFVGLPAVALPAC
jgi:hypothetical protein